MSEKYEQTKEERRKLRNQKDEKGSVKKILKGCVKALLGEKKEKDKGQF